MLGLARTILDHFGYVLWKRDFLVYGVLPWRDISRLSRAWGIQVNTFFDVGANVGQTAQVVLEAFPTSRVLSFEPHPETFQQLNSMQHPRFAAYPLAFSDREGDVPLYEYGRSDSGTQINSLVPDARFPTQFGYTPQERIAKCLTIDRFCETEAISKIDVLKLDTEGSELFVLKGAERILRAGKVTFILTEYNDLLPKNGTTGGSLLPIADLLSSHDYTYICSYTDRVMETDMYVCANALFAKRPA